MGALTIEWGEGEFKKIRAHVTKVDPCEAFVYKKHGTQGYSALVRSQYSQILRRNFVSCDEGRAWCEQEIEEYLLSPSPATTILMYPSNGYTWYHVYDEWSDCHRWSAYYDAGSICITYVPQQAYLVFIDTDAEREFETDSLREAVKKSIGYLEAYYQLLLKISESDDDDMIQIDVSTPDGGTKSYSVPRFRS